MVHGTGYNYTKVHKGYVGGVGMGKHTNLKCVTQKVCLFFYKSVIPPQTEVVIILMLQRADHTCVTKKQRWEGGGAGTVNLSNQGCDKNSSHMLLGIW